MSPSSSPQLLPPTPNPVGLWFCQISSGLQRRRHSGRAEPEGAMNGADGTEQVTKELKAAAAADKKDAPRRTSTTCRREAMPETTVCLLLDRFAPS